ncbi:hypothetical protein RFI_00913, partial [Reticulomyxa filosa]
GDINAKNKKRGAKFFFNTLVLERLFLSSISTLSESTGRGFLILLRPVPSSSPISPSSGDSFSFSPFVIGDLDLGIIVFKNSLARVKSMQPKKRKKKLRPVKFANFLFFPFSQNRQQKTSPFFLLRFLPVGKTTCWSSEIRIFYFFIVATFKNNNSPYAISFQNIFNSNATKMMESERKSRREFPKFPWDIMIASRIFTTVFCFSFEQKDYNIHQDEKKGCDSLKCFKEKSSKKKANNVLAIVSDSSHFF